MLKKIAIVSLLLMAASAVVAQSVPPMRLTPTEIRNMKQADNNVGSSAAAGIHTNILFGDPTKAGFYALLLYVPAHTKIQAHSHRDSRVSTVVSGEWHFGYGDHFDDKGLKTLPVGSVYSEPGGQNHFGETAADAVVVEVSGYGPTDTKYFDPANEPKPAAAPAPAKK